MVKQGKLHIDELIKRFGKGAVLGTGQIAVFYRTIEPDVKETTVNWRIHSLVRNGILTRIGYGKYIIGNRKKYIPEISPGLKVLGNKLKKQFPFLDYCIWSTSLFNEFMLHQPARFYRIVEVEKEAAESVFYFMKEKKYSVFLTPSKELLSRYVPDEKETWIVKPLVTEAPVQLVSGVPVTTLEKLLVDLFCDVLLFDAQQGSERDRIFQEAMAKYAVNTDKMLRYAGRRGKRKELEKYIGPMSKLRQQINNIAKI